MLWWIRWKSGGRQGLCNRCKMWRPIASFLLKNQPSESCTTLKLSAGADARATAPGVAAPY